MKIVERILKNELTIQNMHTFGDILKCTFRAQTFAGPRLAHFRGAPITIGEFGQKIWAPNVPFKQSNSLNAVFS